MTETISTDPIVMRGSNRLVLIKRLHTLVWLFLSSVILFVLYGGLFDDVTVYTWIGVGMVMIEGTVLLVNRWTCPLSTLARRYTTDCGDNFDIYLPVWLARHNKTISTAVFLVAVLSVLYRVA